MRHSNSHSSDACTKNLAAQAPAFYIDARFFNSKHRQSDLVLTKPNFEDSLTTSL